MKVLVIEDNKADQRLLQEMFRDMNMPAFELVFAENLTKGIAYLDSEDIGIVLLDLGLPESQGLDTFLRLKEHAEYISVIVLTGLDDSSIALNALKEGAQDYLMKGWISTEILKKSIIYAIERQRLIEELRQSNREILFREERFRTLIEKNADAMVVVNKKEEVQYQNPAAELLFEGAPADYLKIPFSSLFEGDKSIEKTLDYPSGIQKIIAIRGVLIEWERLPAFLLTIRDITERKLAEEKIERLNRVLRALRNVNQLITKENNRDNLLKGACDNLTETRGYSSAWIALFDDNGTLLFTTESGLGTAFLPVLERLQRGELTECGHHVLRQPGLFIKDPLSGCADCPLATTRAENVVMAARLEYGTKTYGMLVVSDPTNLTPDVEEQSLFQELVDDIAFGLFKIEMEEQRKQAEENLKISLAKYKVLFESLPIAITISDKLGNIVESNTRAEEILGLSDEEQSKRKIDGTEWQLIRPDGTPLPADEYASVRALKENRLVQNVEMGIIKENSAVTWINVTAAPIPLKDYGVAIAYNDLTERKKAEGALQQSEERFRELADSITDVFFAMDKDLRYTYWNRASEKLTGIPAQDAIGKSIFQIFPDTPEIRRSIEVYQDVLKTKQTRNFENEYELGGKRFYFDISVYPTADGIAVITTDITERKRAEDALRESRDRFEVTLASIDDAILLVDPANHIISECNDATTRIFGYSREELVGRETNFLHVDQAHLEQFGREAGATYEEPGYYTREFEMRRKDGSVFPTEHFVRPIHDSDGRIRYVVSVVRDITNRKRAEEEIRALNRDLEKRVEERTNELREKNQELEIFNKAMVDREMRIIEIKEEVNRLCQELGREPKYMTIP